MELKVGDAIPADAQVEEVPSPLTFASAIEVALATNDIALTFSQPKLGHVVQGNMRTPVQRNVPVAVIAMSAGTAKDLLRALGTVVDQYEAQFGEVKTAFTEKK